MSEIHIKKPNKRTIKWAIRREFEVMAEVDPVFRPEFMSMFRRLLWKYVGMPSLYQRAEGFIAELDGVDAGFSFSYIRPMMMRIDSFMVEPEQRNKGVGTNLLKSINDFADEYEIRYLVSAVPRENPKGFEFAKKMGFKPYRNMLLNLDDTSKLMESAAKVEVEKLPLNNAKDQYDKWLYVELESGDAWAYDLIQSEFAELGFNRVGTHWSCLFEKSSKGYLRLIENAGKVTVYLACDPEYWEDDIQLDWIRAALEETGSEPESMEIMFASGGHHEAAKELFSNQGFEEGTRVRHLIVKDLGPISADEEKISDDRDSQ